MLQFHVIPGIRMADIINLMEIKSDLHTFYAGHFLSTKHNDTLRKWVAILIQVFFRQYP